MSCTTDLLLWLRLWGFLYGVNAQFQIAIIYSAFFHGSAIVMCHAMPCHGFDLLTLAHLFSLNSRLWRRCMRNALAEKTCDWLQWEWVQLIKPLDFVEQMKRTHTQKYTHQKHIDRHTLDSENKIPWWMFLNVNYITQNIDANHFFIPFSCYIYVFSSRSKSNSPSFCSFFSNEWNLIVKQKKNTITSPRQIHRGNKSNAANARS